MTRVTETIAQVGQALAGLCVALLTLHVFADVIGLWLGLPLRGTPQIAAELYMPGIVFGALAMVQHRCEEIRVDLIGMTSPRLAAALDRAAQVLVAGAALWLAWHTGLQAQRAWAIGAAIEVGLTRIPVWPGKAALPLGLVFLAWAALARLIRPAAAT